VTVPRSDVTGVIEWGSLFTPSSGKCENQ